MEANDREPVILLVTPPFTQLNTAYPATACLKGFLDTKQIRSHQCDLGIEVTDRLFSPEGLTSLFSGIDQRKPHLTANARRMVQMQEAYARTIAPVMAFLRGSQPGLAHLICSELWLPRAARFNQITDLDHDFGHLGLHDRAKHLGTLYLEDIADLITETTDPHFGFSRYAERLGRSASSFDELHDALNAPASFTDTLLITLLEEKIHQYNPTMVAITVPFPGNLYSAFKCGQWLRANRPGVKIVMGGGFVNTELRSLSDPRVFDYTDFITLDDGETPLLNLIEHLGGKRSLEHLKRTFSRVENEVVYFDGSAEQDVTQCDTGTPDYSGLPLDKYLSVLEVANPMHRLWSDGNWNKLMLAHGCYWGKCTFCDVTLDYIKRYEPNKASVICDRMEAIIAQTGRNGFHFTDEAAPPALMREVALEILLRKLTVVWWTNIRFENSFTPDMCFLLKKSGCIAVSGGLEVASDRILALISKGVTVAQVARVAGNFTRAGIMVHAYLMFGFPTQSAQETIDSLEVVRQLFMNGVVQSGFWHQFAMTAHSPVGLDPQRFGIERENTPPGTFANNDLVPVDRTGCDHGAFSNGLKKSLYNYMHGICFDFPLQEWFDFRIPRTTVAPGFIRGVLSREPADQPAPHARVEWLGETPSFTFQLRQKKGKSIPSIRLVIQTASREESIYMGEEAGRWLMDVFPRFSPGNQDLLTFRQLEELFASAGHGDFSAFWKGPVFSLLKEHGLVCL